MYLYELYRGEITRVYGPLTETPKGRRYYTDKQYKDHMGIQEEKKVGERVIYIRASNRGQKDDLENQIEVLKTLAHERGIIVDEAIEDIGSDLNYNRK